MLNEIEKANLAFLKKHAGNFKEAEDNMIVGLIDAARLKYFRKLGHVNLLEFIRKEARIDSTVSFNLQSVVYAALKFPCLEEALTAKALNPAKAARMVKAMTEENAVELVAFASTHTFEELNRYIANGAKPLKTRESCKILSADQVRVSYVISMAEFEILKRLQDVEAQRKQPCKMRDVAALANRERLARIDPVAKADRANAKVNRDNEKVNLAHANFNRASEKINRAHTKTERVVTKPKIRIEIKKTSSVSRQRLTAAQRHAVHARDRGQCTHVHPDGTRCTQKRHVEIHHVIPVSEGGSNDPTNLSTLCWPHHDLAHQLDLFHGYSRAQSGSSAQPE